jgi:subtilisin
VPPQDQPSDGKVITDEYIVVLDEDALAEDSEEPQEVAQDDEAEHSGLDVERVYGAALEGYAAEIPEGEVRDVENDPEVLFVSEVHEFRASQTGDMQATPLSVDRIDAEQSSLPIDTVPDTVSVGIAVLDSGIDAAHPDLNVVGGKDCTSSPGDAFNDAYGHGTASAGVAAAEDNGFGVVGVAHGAPLYAVKVLGENGRGSDASVICGVDWVTANADKIEVVNMSLASPGFRDDGRCGLKNEDAVHHAICRSVDAGVTYVVSAGNDSKNFKNYAPASYDEVLTSTAMTDTDGEPGGDGPPPCIQGRYYDDRAATPFSNHTAKGSGDVDHTISAPGVCNETTLPEASYGFGTGTSFSSPLVAGTAALYKLAHPLATPREVIQQLRADAREQPRSYGFRGDPRHRIKNRYYGHLVYAGEY